MDEKRDSRRVDLFASLQGEVTVFQPLKIREISRRGMQVATPFALHLDAHHDFRLTLGDRAIVVTGRIAHSRISQVNQDAVVFLTGVEFIELSESAQSIIGEFVELMRLAEFKFPTQGKGTND